jgi:ion channel POLLUX/CASTOR
VNNEKPTPPPSAWTANASHRQGKALFRRNRGRKSSASKPGGTSSTGSAGAKLRYRFDAALSKGPSVVISWLGVLTLGIILLSAAVLTVFRVVGVNGGKRLGIAEAFWQSLLRVIDGGSFAADAGWTARLIGLVVTLAGIFIAGSLIGLIANAVDQQIEELRKGRSQVLERDHTLILGWSNRVSAIVRELTIANESQKRAAVVIVSTHDKTEMEETLRSEVGDPRTTRIVCRSGEPWLPQNLVLGNVARAKSIIVVGDGDDAATVKVLLAVRAVTGESHAHIVAEVSDPATAASLEALLGNSLVTVNSDDIVAELTAQACRQRGLSTVFRELLDFDGDELYFAPFPQLAGKTYAQSQLSFERCALIGRLHDGVVELNPPPSTVLAVGDELIGIAEDDSVFVASAQITASVLAVEVVPPSTARRRIVISGWSELGPRVLDELDEFLDSSTTILLMLDPTRVDIPAVRASVSTRNVKLEITELTEGPEVVAAAAARESFHEVIVLGYRDSMTTDQADALTLLTLLAFRQVRQNEDLGPVRMVAELLDQRHAPLAAASGADDFIVSDELTSLMLAQLSERHELIQVFKDLFDRSGASIGLRPAREYGAQRARSFADIVATASAAGHSAIGFRRAATGEVVVNPAKSVNPGLSVDDEVLVIAPSGAAA